MSRFLTIILGAFALLFGGQSVLGQNQQTASELFSQPASRQGWQLPPGDWPQIPCKVVMKAQKISSVLCEKTRPFEDDELWGLLDHMAGSSAWMEVDFSGVLSEELKQLSAGSRQAWVLWSPGFPPQIAVLKSPGSSASLQFSLLNPSGSWKNVPRSLQIRFEGRLQEFPDFDLRSSSRCEIQSDLDCELAHASLPFTVRFSDRKLLMRYLKPDRSVLEGVPGYAEMDERSRQKSIEDFRFYFRQELALAVKLFLGTTQGLFDWQMWHWLKVESRDGFLSDTAIDAYLRAQQMDLEVMLFRRQVQDGRFVEIKSNAQGMLQLEIRE